MGHYTFMGAGFKVVYLDVTGHLCTDTVTAISSTGTVLDDANE